MKTVNGNKLKVNAFLNVIRQLVSVIFPLITFPYVSRTLGVECYGKVNYTASIIGYISLIAGLGISNYAVREGSRLREDYNKFVGFVKEIFTLNFLALMVSYIFLFIIILFYGNNETYRSLLLIQGIGVLFSVIGCEWLNIIYEDYFFITVRYIAFQTLSVILILLLVKSPDDLLLYAVIGQIGGVFANVSNIIHFYKRWDVKLGFSFNWHIFSHLKYVLILFGNAVSMLIYVNSDVTLIGIFRGDNEVGLYSVAVKIYTIVKQLLNAMMVVGVPQMSRWTGKKRKKEVDRQLDDILSTLLVFLIPSIVGLFCLSKQVIGVMAGNDYSTSVDILKVLSITLLFSTGVCFYSNLVLIPNNMEKYILKATGISAIFNIVLNAIFIPMFGMIAAAYTTLLSEAFSVIYMVVISRKKYFPKVSRIFFYCLISGAMIYICCFIVKFLMNGLIQTIIYSLVLSAICWFVYWWLLIRCNKINLN